MCNLATGLAPQAQLVSCGRVELQGPGWRSTPNMDISGNVTLSGIVMTNNSIEMCSLQHLFDISWAGINCSCGPGQPRRGLCPVCMSKILIWWQTNRDNGLTQSHCLQHPSRGYTIHRTDQPGWLLGIHLFLFFVSSEVVKTRIGESEEGRNREKHKKKTRKRRRGRKKRRKGKKREKESFSLPPGAGGENGTDKQLLKKYKSCVSAFVTGQLPSSARPSPRPLTV